MFTTALITAHMDTTFERTTNIYAKTINIPRTTEYVGGALIRKEEPQFNHIIS